MRELLIFVHIPKTAGSSFVKAVTSELAGHEFKLLYGVGKLQEDIEGELVSLSQSDKSSLKFIAGHQVWYGIHKFFPERDCRYITFVRDPVKRVISNYFKIKRDPEHSLHQTLINPNLNLEKFISGEISPVVMNHMTVFLGRNSIRAGHNICQCSKFDEYLLRDAKENLKKFWFVGVTERYSFDLKLLSKKIGIKLEECRVNMAPSDQIPKSEITQDLLTKCEELNQMDREIYELVVKARRAGM